MMKSWFQSMSQSEKPVEIETTNGPTHLTMLRHHVHVISIEQKAWASRNYAGKQRQTV